MNDSKAGSLQQESFTQHRTDFRIIHSQKTVRNVLDSINDERARKDV